MPFAYVVRCNFSDPAQEDAWNRWYSGPKLRDMLKKPLFLSGQRFEASGLHTARKYLALWFVESPDAFETPEYKSDWGFFEWKSYITDWSRDLYTVPEATSIEPFRVAADETLHIVSFDGMDDAGAAAIAPRIAELRPDLTILEAAGLDRHSPLIALGTQSAGAPPPDPIGIEGVQETIFSPISHCMTAAEAAESGAS